MFLLIEGLNKQAPWQCNYFKNCFFSGMLSGKYKRKVRCRLRQEELELKAIEVAPAWSQYDHNEDFWKLVEGMERIANENGFPDLKDI